MQCFSLAWLEQFLIWFVVVAVIVAIIKLIVPAIMSWAGAPPGGNIVITVISYVIWGVITIYAIILAFSLIACMLGGVGLPILPLRH